MDGDETRGLQHGLDVRPVIEAFDGARPVRAVWFTAAYLLSARATRSVSDPRRRAYYSTDSSYVPWYYDNRRRPTVPDSGRRPMAECPECGGDVDLPEVVEIGEIVDCGTCGSELEVVDDDPVSLAAAPELEEDWGE